MRTGLLVMAGIVALIAATMSLSAVPADAREMTISMCGTPVVVHTWASDGSMLLPLDPVLKSAGIRSYEFFPQGNLSIPFRPTMGFIRITRYDGRNVQMNIGQDFATLEGVPYWLERPADRYGTVVLVPPKFIALVTGTYYCWDRTSGQLMFYR